MASTLVHRLHESVQRAPEAEAIVWQGRRTRYADLWRQSCATAAWLRGQGLAPGDRVALLLENSPQYVAAYYGILAAGGVAVGLNTEARARDIRHWLRHSGAGHLFASRRYPEFEALAGACEGQVGLVDVDCSGAEADDGWARVQACDAEAPDWSLLSDPARLAAIIYTSGTTGAPKGVMQSHRNLDSNIASIVSYLHLDAGDSVLNVLPFYYTYGNSVLHTHLASGGRVVLENSLLYPRKVLETLAAEQVTGFSGVPSTYALLLNRTRLEDFDLSSLRYMTQAGGPMPPAAIERLLEIVPHVAFYVMYGQTEATARLTWLPPERLRDKLGSVGIAIPGVEIEIRDEETFEPLPAGVTGEICARGDNITPGYWQNPEATARVLRDGWLRTGDLAHRDEEGYIYMDGRRSDMIKSGANRIAPQEIEEVIAEMDEVAEVAVVGVPEDILGQVIKAVIVPRAGAGLQPRAVQAWCRRNLAGYKVPKFIEFVQELPKTASGKIRRHVLQETNRGQ